MLLKNANNNEVVQVIRISTDSNNVLTARYRDIDHYNRKLTDLTDWDQPKFEHVMCPDLESRMAATMTAANATVSQAMTSLGYAIVKETRFKSEEGWEDFDETLV